MKRTQLIVLILAVALPWWLAFRIGIDGGKAIGRALFG